MQPMTPSSWRRDRSWLQFNVQEKWIHEMSLLNIPQDKTNNKSTVKRNGILLVK